MPAQHDFSEAALAQGANQLVVVDDIIIRVGFAFAVNAQLTIERNVEDFALIDVLDIIFLDLEPFAVVKLGLAVGLLVLHFLAGLLQDVLQLYVLEEVHLYLHTRV